MKVLRLLVALTLFLVARPGRADDPKRYEAIDAHALKATAQDEASLPSLARYLAKPCKTDRDKARAIYRWITDRIAYDVEAWTTGRIPAQNPAAVLRSRKAVCHGFCDLFVDLSQRTGVKAVRIPGWAKISTHKPGNKVTIPQLSHSWNTAYFEGEWHLIDPTWGAGHTEGPTFVKLYRDFYFLVPSEPLLFTHFPTDPKWQLTKKPLTIKQFEHEPHVKEHFELGFGVQKVRDVLKSGEELVKVPTLGGQVTAVKAPLTKRLKAGTEYEFEIKTTAYTKLFLNNNKKPSAFLVQEGDVYRVSVQPEKGTLTLAGRVDALNLNLLVLSYVVE